MTATVSDATQHAARLITNALASIEAARRDVARLARLQAAAILPLCEDAAGASALLAAVPRVLEDLEASGWRIEGDTVAPAIADALNG